MEVNSISFKSELFNKCSTELLSPDGKEYVCGTCVSHLKKDHCPPCAVYNGNSFPFTPEALTDLSSLEWRLLAPRLPFMKIHQAPRGGQYKITGNVVNVPCDVNTTLTSLPRLPDDCQTIHLKLKRHLKYKSAVMSQNIRPEKVRSAAEHLITHGKLYKDLGITLNQSWTVSDGNSSDENNEEENDSDSETDDTDEVSTSSMAGIHDTLLTSPEFLESNEKDLVYNIAPGQYNQPVSIFKDQNAEELAFPDIFHGTPRPTNSQRKTPLTYGQLCKVEIRNYDRRVAKNIDNIFFKTKKLQMKQLLDKAQIAIRKCRTKGEKFTAAVAKNTSRLQDFIHKDKAYKILNTIRGSPPYFQKANKDLMAMIRTLGPATFFISCSAAETRWKHLLKILIQLVDKKDASDEDIEQLTWPDICRLIQSDPITCARQFDYQVETLYSYFLKSSLQPLGEVSDYFRRVEFQHRGSPHIHSLLWVNDSPRIDVDSDEDVVEFVDTFITCHKPMDDSELSKLVKLQIHRHSHTCRRRDKCRFGFPHPPLLQTMVIRPLDPLEYDIKKLKKKWTEIKMALENIKDDEDLSIEEFLESVQVTYENYILAIRSSITKPTIMLRRTVNEIHVNAYNKDLLAAWRANIDVQFITDTYACAMYVASYIIKAERGMSELLRKTCDEVKKGDHSLRDQLRTIGGKFLNSVELSAQEASYILLQLPMKKASRQVIFVNTSPPEERVFLLKPIHVLESMDDNDTNVQSTGLIERYANRPNTLEKTTLAEFAAYYTSTTRGYKSKGKVQQKQDFLPEPDDEDNTEDTEPAQVDSQQMEGGNQFKRRHTPYILRTVHFNKEQQPENYYREKLMLYTAWRNENTLIGQCNSFKERFLLLKDDIKPIQEQFEEYSEDVDNALSQMHEDDRPEDQWDEIAPSTRDTDSDTDTDNEHANSDMLPSHYDLAEELGLPPSHMEEELRQNKQMLDEEYRQLMQSLNAKQRAFLCHIVDHVKSTNEPIYRFISGGAGVGKTHLTLALHQTLLRFYNSKPGGDQDSLTVLLLAPTGKAAYLIKGNTIHSAFKVPVNQALTYRSLDTDRMTTLRVSLAKLRLIIIDEVSMVGTRLLTFIHKRLQDLTLSSKDFGGISIISVGDLYQLKPVCDSYMFLNSDHEYGPLATNLWCKNFHMLELTDIMRQRENKDFAEILNRLREGIHSESDIKILKTREMQPEEVLNNLQHLYTTNAEVDIHNTSLYLGSVNQKCVISAVDSVVGHVNPDVRKKILETIPDNPRKTMQLATNLQVACELRYDLSLNVAVHDGLTNGATCTIKKIQLTKKSCAKGIIWVQFDDLTIGTATRQEHSHLYRGHINKSWTPIIPVSRQFTVGKYKNSHVLRYQFPLRQSAAKTIHRSQGDTLNEVVVDFTGQKRAVHHNHYVAFSRVKTLQGLHLRNFNPSKICTSDAATTEMKRLRDSSPQVSLHGHRQEEVSFRITYANAQSLHRHIQDVRADAVVQNSDVAIFAETRLLPTDLPTDITGFQATHFFDITEHQDRPFHGLSVYVKDPKVISPFKKNPTELEIVHFSVRYDSTSALDNDLLVLALYKPPKLQLNQLLKTLTPLMDELDVKHRKAIILGDFNIDLSDSKSSTAKHITSFFETYGYHNQVTGHTTDGKTMIDLLFTSNQLTNYSVVSSDTYYSYHRSISIDLY